MKSFVNLLKLQLKRPIRSRSLTVTLAFGFLALSLFVLFIYSSLSIYFSFRNQREVINIQQQLIAQRAADSVKDFIDDKFTALNSAIDFTNLHKASQNDQKLVLEKLLGMEPSFRHLILFDAHEQELLHVSRLSHMVSAHVTEHIRQELFSQARQSTRYISSIIIDEITSEPLVIMAVPVTNVFGDVQGILAAEVNLKFMWDLVGHIKIGRSGYAYVVDKEGYLIAFQDIGRVLKRENISFMAEVREFVNGNESAHLSKAEISKGILGITVLTTHVHLGTPSWAVVVELPILEAYETVIRTFVFSLLIMICSFILAIISGVFLAKRMTKPIIELRDATERVGKGKLDTQIAVRSKNEIGQLATSFNQMIKDLKKVTVSRNALAKEVKQRKRTEEALQRAYDELKASKERERERAAQLEASNRELEAFSYSVSHDLRAPLRGIDGFSQALLEDYADQLDTQGRDYLQRVRAATQRLEQIIDDMLILSRVTRIEMRRVMVDLSTMAQEIAVELQASQPERRVSFVIAPGLAVKADPNLMRLALENLLDNAWKFTSKHPAARIEVGVTNHEGGETYYVRDDGAGFDMAYAGKLFGAFQRLHPMVDFGGTGIGLATVQRIIRRHGGRVWAEGSVEQGATFYFTLPR
jgi:signal transduction histidine kinase